MLHPARAEAQSEAHKLGFAKSGCRPPRPPKYPVEVPGPVLHPPASTTDLKAVFASMSSRGREAAELQPDSGCGGWRGTRVRSRPDPETREIGQLPSARNQSQFQDGPSNPRHDGASPTDTQSRRYATNRTPPGRTHRTGCLNAQNL